MVLEDVAFLAMFGENGERVYGPKFLCMVLGRRSKFKSHLFSVTSGKSINLFKPQSFSDGK